MDQQYQQQQESKKKQKVQRKPRPQVCHGRHCPHCGAEVNDTCELCPVCGKPIDNNHCTFCGAEMESGEQFCAECGSSRTGIKCPQCGTLSFRSFCSKCNTPLNDSAFAFLEEAKKDPKFQKAQKLNAELAELEAYLIEFKEEIEQAIAEEEAGGAPDAPGLSAEGERLRAQYAELMALLGQKPAATPAAVQSKPKPKKREQIKLKFHDASGVMDAYRQKLDEMQDTLRSMLPDASLTPQQQRDYMCARKVATITRTKSQVATWWVCNYCGCYHRQPSECVEPKLGGTWLHEEIEIETKTWNYVK